MKGFIVVCTLVISALLLSGCNTEGHVSVSANYDDIIYDDAIDDTIFYNDHTHYPTLEYFGMIDTYGISSSKLNAPLILNPYESNGHFEIFWQANFSFDYVVEYRINDAPTITDSTLINSDYCGNNMTCDQDGLQFCDYYANLSVSCDSFSYLERGPEISISHLIHTLPQTLYFITQVCDTAFEQCEYIYRPVLME